MSSDPKPKCVFCPGTGKRSGEHIYSEWMHPLLEGHRNLTPTRISGRHFLFPGGVEMRRVVKPRKGDNPLGRRCFVVCEDCNSGWMSAIDSGAIDVLTPLIKGEAHTLTAEAQRTVAKWGTLKFMVLDANIEKPVVTPEERHAFRTTGAIPQKLLIRIGAMNVFGWQTTFETFATKMSGDFGGKRYSGSLSSCLFCVGNFFFYFHYFGPFPVPARDIITDVVSLWPEEAKDFEWPPPVGNESDMMHLVRSLPPFFNSKNATLAIERDIVPLRVIGVPRPDAVIFEMHAPFVGDELSDLVCGMVLCRNVLCRGVSLEGMREHLSPAPQLLLKCWRCNSLNLVPVKGTQPVRPKRG